MATYDSADLLARMKRYAHRPATDESFDDADYYQLLGEAQQEAVKDIVVRVPHAMMGAPVRLTSADSGATYTFGTDADGTAKTPLGHVELYATDAGTELLASTYGEGEGDLVLEGNTLRVPQGLTRTWDGAGPYARFCTMPLTLDASTPPALEPEWARMLIVWKALEHWCMIGGLRDPADFARKYNELLPKVILALKTQFKSRNAPGSGRTRSAWWQTLSRNV